MAENASTDGGMSGDGPNGSSSDSGSRGDSSDRADSRADARSGSTADTRAGAEAQAHDSGSGWGVAVNDLAPVGQAMTGTPAEMAAVSREMQDQSNAANAAPLSRAEEAPSAIPTTPAGLMGVKNPFGAFAVNTLVGMSPVGPAAGLIGMGARGLNAMNAANKGAVHNEVNEAAGIGRAPSESLTADGGRDGGLIGATNSQDQVAANASSPVNAIADQPSVDYTMYGHVDASGWGQAINDYASKKSAQRGTS